MDLSNVGGLLELPFQCGICGKDFVSDDLENHMKSHEEEDLTNLSKTVAENTVEKQGEFKTNWTAENVSNIVCETRGLKEDCKRIDSRAKTSVHSGECHQEKTKANSLAHKAVVHEENERTKGDLKGFSDCLTKSDDKVVKGKAKGKSRSKKPQYDGDTNNPTHNVELQKKVIKETVKCHKDPAEDLTKIKSAKGKGGGKKPTLSQDSEKLIPEVGFDHQVNQIKGTSAFVDSKKSAKCLPKLDTDKTIKKPPTSEKVVPEESLQLPDKDLKESSVQNDIKNTKQKGSRGKAKKSSVDSEKLEPKEKKMASYTVLKEERKQMSFDRKHLFQHPAKDDILSINLDKKSIPNTDKPVEVSNVKVNSVKPMSKNVSKCISTYKDKSLHSHAITNKTGHSLEDKHTPKTQNLVETIAGFTGETNAVNYVRSEESKQTIKQKKEKSLSQSKLDILKSNPLNPEDLATPETDKQTDSSVLPTAKKQRGRSSGKKERNTPSVHREKNSPLNATDTNPDARDMHAANKFHKDSENLFETFNDEMSVSRKDSKRSSSVKKKSSQLLLIEESRDEKPHSHSKPDLQSNPVSLEITESDKQSESPAFPKEKKHIGRSASKTERKTSSSQGRKSSPVKAKVNNPNVRGMPAAEKSFKDSENLFEKFQNEISVRTEDSKCTSSVKKNSSQLLSTTEHIDEKTQSQTKSVSLGSNPEDLTMPETEKHAESPEFSTEKKQRGRSASKKERKTPSVRSEKHSPFSAKDNNPDVGAMPAADKSHTDYEMLFKNVIGEMSEVTDGSKCSSINDKKSLQLVLTEEHRDEKSQSQTKSVSLGSNPETTTMPETDKHTKSVALPTEKKNRGRSASKKEMKNPSAQSREKSPIKAKENNPDAGAMLAAEKTLKDSEKLLNNLDDETTVSTENGKCSSSDKKKSAQLLLTEEHSDDKSQSKTMSDTLGSNPEDRMMTETDKRSDSPALPTAKKQRGRSAGKTDRKPHSTQRRKSSPLKANEDNRDARAMHSVEKPDKDSVNLLERLDNKTSVRAEASNCSPSGKKTSSQFLLTKEPINVKSQTKPDSLENNPVAMTETDKPTEPEFPTVKKHRGRSASKKERKGPSVPSEKNSHKAEENNPDAGAILAANTSNKDSEIPFENLDNKRSVSKEERELTSSEKKNHSPLLFIKDNRDEKSQSQTKSDPLESNPEDLATSKTDKHAESPAFSTEKKQRGRSAGKTDRKPHSTQRRKSSPLKANEDTQNARAMHSVKKPDIDSVNLLEKLDDETPVSTEDNMCTSSIEERTLQLTFTEESRDKSNSVEYISAKESKHTHKQRKSNYQLHAQPDSCDSYSEDKTNLKTDKQKKSSVFPTDEKHNGKPVRKNKTQKPSTYRKRSLKSMAKIESCQDIALPVTDTFDKLPELQSDEHSHVTSASEETDKQVTADVPTVPITTIIERRIEMKNTSSPRRKKMQTKGTHENLNCKPNEEAMAVNDIQEEQSDFVLESQAIEFSKRNRKLASPGINKNARLLIDSAMLDNITDEKAMNDTIFKTENKHKAAHRKHNPISQSEDYISNHDLYSKTASVVSSNMSEPKLQCPIQAKNKCASKEEEHHKSKLGNNLKTNGPSDNFISNTELKEKHDSNNRDNLSEVLENVQVCAQSTGKEDLHTISGRKKKSRSRSKTKTIESIADTDIQLLVKQNDSNLANELNNTDPLEPLFPTDLQKNGADANEQEITEKSTPKKKSCAKTDIVNSLSEEEKAKEQKDWKEPNSVDSNPGQISKAKNNLMNPSKGKQSQQYTPLSDGELLKLYGIHSSIVKLNRLSTGMEFSHGNNNDSKDSSRSVSPEKVLSHSVESIKTSSQDRTCGGQSKLMSDKNTLLDNIAAKQKGESIELGHDLEPEENDDHLLEKTDIDVSFSKISKRKGKLQNNAKSNKKHGKRRMPVATSVECMHEQLFEDKDGVGSSHVINKNVIINDNIKDFSNNTKSLDENEKVSKFSHGNNKDTNDSSLFVSPEIVLSHAVESITSSQSSSQDRSYGESKLRSDKNSLVDYAEAVGKGESIELGHEVETEENDDHLLENTDIDDVPLSKISKRKGKLQNTARSNKKHGKGRTPVATSVECLHEQLFEDKDGASSSHVINKNFIINENMKDLQNNEKSFDENEKLSEKTEAIGKHVNTVNSDEKQLNSLSLNIVTMVKNPIEIPQEEIEQTLFALGLGTSLPMPASDPNTKRRRSKSGSKTRTSGQSKSPEASTSRGKMSCQKKTARKSVKDQTFVDKLQLEVSKKHLRSLTKIEKALINNPHSPFGKSSWLKHKFDLDSESDDDWEIDLPIDERVSQASASNSLVLDPRTNLSTTNQASSNEKTLLTTTLPSSHRNTSKDIELMKKYGISDVSVVVKRTSLLNTVLLENKNASHIVCPDTVKRTDVRVNAIPIEKAGSTQRGQFKETLQNAFTIKASNLCHNINADNRELEQQNVTDKQVINKHENVSDKNDSGNQNDKNSETLESIVLEPSDIQSNKAMQETEDEEMEAENSQARLNLSVQVDMKRKIGIENISEEQTEQNIPETVKSGTVLQSIPLEKSMEGKTATPRGRKRGRKSKLVKCIKENTDSENKVSDTISDSNNKTVNANCSDSQNNGDSNDQGKINSPSCSESSNTIDKKRTSSETMTPSNAKKRKYCLVHESTQGNNEICDTMPGQPQVLEKDEITVSNSVTVLEASSKMDKCVKRKKKQNRKKPVNVIEHVENKVTEEPNNSDYNIERPLSEDTSGLPPAIEISLKELNNDEQNKMPEKDSINSCQDEGTTDQFEHSKKVDSCDPVSKLSEEKTDTIVQKKKRGRKKLFKSYSNAENEMACKGGLHLRKESLSKKYTDNMCDTGDINNEKTESTPEAAYQADQFSNAEDVCLSDIVCSETYNSTQKVKASCRKKMTSSVASLEVVQVEDSSKTVSLTEVVALSAHVSIVDGSHGITSVTPTQTNSQENTFVVCSNESGETLSEGVSVLEHNDEIVKRSNRGRKKRGNGRKKGNLITNNTHLSNKKSDVVHASGVLQVEMLNLKNQVENCQKDINIDETFSESTAEVARNEKSCEEMSGSSEHAQPEEINDTKRQSNVHIETLKQTEKETCDNEFGSKHTNMDTSNTDNKSDHGTLIPDREESTCSNSEVEAAPSVVAQGIDTLHQNILQAPSDMVSVSVKVDRKARKKTKSGKGRKKKVKSVAKKTTALSSIQSDNVTVSEKSKIDNIDGNPKDTDIESSDVKSIVGVAGNEDVNEEVNGSPKSKDKNDNKSQRDIHIESLKLTEKETNDKELGSKHRNMDTSNTRKHTNNKSDHETLIPDREDSKTCSISEVEVEPSNVAQDLDTLNQNILPALSDMVSAKGEWPVIKKTKTRRGRKKKVRKIVTQKQTALSNKLSDLVTAPEEPHVENFDGNSQNNDIESLDIKSMVGKAGNEDIDEEINGYPKPENKYHTESQQDVLMESLDHTEKESNDNGHVSSQETSDIPKTRKHTDNEKDLETLIPDRRVGETCSNSEVEVSSNVVQDIDTLQHAIVQAPSDMLLAKGEDAARKKTRSGRGRKKKGKKIVTQKHTALSNIQSDLVTLSEESHIKNLDEHPQDTDIESSDIKSMVGKAGNEDIDEEINSCPKPEDKNHTESLSNVHMESLKQTEEETQDNECGSMQKEIDTSNTRKHTENESGHENIASIPYREEGKPCSNSEVRVEPSNIAHDIDILQPDCLQAPSDLVSARLEGTARKKTKSGRGRRKKGKTVAQKPAALSNIQSDLITLSEETQIENLNGNPKYADFESSDIKNMMGLAGHKDIEEKINGSPKPQDNNDMESLNVIPIESLKQTGKETNDIELCSRINHSDTSNTSKHESDLETFTPDRQIGKTCSNSEDKNVLLSNVEQDINTLQQSIVPEPSDVILAKGVGTVRKKSKSGKGRKRNVNKNVAQKHTALSNIHSDLSCVAEESQIEKLFGNPNDTNIESSDIKSMVGIAGNEDKDEEISGSSKLQANNDMESQRDIPVESCKQTEKELNDNELDSKQKNTDTFNTSKHTENESVYVIVTPDGKGGKEYSNSEVEVVPSSNVAQDLDTLHQNILQAPSEMVSAKGEGTARKKTKSGRGRKKKVKKIVAQKHKALSNIQSDLVTVSEESQIENVDRNPKDTEIETSDIKSIVDRAGNEDTDAAVNGSPKPEDKSNMESQRDIPMEYFKKTEKETHENELGSSEKNKDTENESDHEHLTCTSNRKEGTPCSSSEVRVVPSDIAQDIDTLQPDILQAPSDVVSAADRKKTKSGRGRKKKVKNVLTQKHTAVSNIQSDLVTVSEESQIEHLDENLKDTDIETLDTKSMVETAENKDINEAKNGYCKPEDKQDIKSQSNISVESFKHSDKELNATAPGSSENNTYSSITRKHLANESDYETFTPDRKITKTCSNSEVEVVSSKDAQDIDTLQQTILQAPSEFVSENGEGTASTKRKSSRGRKKKVKRNAKQKPRALSNIQPNLLTVSEKSQIENLDEIPKDTDIELIRSMIGIAETEDIDEEINNSLKPEHKTDMESQSDVYLESLKQTERETLQAPAGIISMNGEGKDTKKTKSSRGRKKSNKEVILNVQDSASVPCHSELPLSDVNAANQKESNIKSFTLKQGEMNSNKVSSDTNSDMSHEKSHELKKDVGRETLSTQMENGPPFDNMVKTPQNSIMEVHKSECQPENNRNDDPVSKHLTEKEKCAVKRKGQWLKKGRRKRSKSIIEYKMDNKELEMDTRVKTTDNEFDQEIIVSPEISSNPRSMDTVHEINTASKCSNYKNQLIPKKSDNITEKEDHLYERNEVSERGKGGNHSAANICRNIWTMVENDTSLNISKSTTTNLKPVVEETNQNRETSSKLPNLSDDNGIAHFDINSAVSQADSDQDSVPKKDKFRRGRRNVSKTMRNKNISVPAYSDVSDNSSATVVLSAETLEANETNIQADDISSDKTLSASSAGDMKKINARGAGDICLSHERTVEILVEQSDTITERNECFNVGQQCSPLKRFSRNVNGVITPTTQVMEDVIEGLEKDKRLEDKQNRFKLSIKGQSDADKSTSEKHIRSVKHRNPALEDQCPNNTQHEGSFYMGNKMAVTAVVHRADSPFEYVTNITKHSKKLNNEANKELAEPLIYPGIQLEKQNENGEADGTCSNRDKSSEPMNWPNDIVLAFTPLEESFRRKSVSYKRIKRKLSKEKDYGNNVCKQKLVLTKRGRHGGWKSSTVESFVNTVNDETISQEKESKTPVVFNNYKVHDECKMEEAMVIHKKRKLHHKQEHFLEKDSLSAQIDSFPEQTDQNVVQQINEEAMYTVETDKCRENVIIMRRTSDIVHTKIYKEHEHLHITDEEAKPGSDHCTLSNISLLDKQIETTLNDTVDGTSGSNDLRDISEEVDAENNSCNNKQDACDGNSSGNSVRLCGEIVATSSCLAGNKGEVHGCIDIINTFEKEDVQMDNNDKDDKLNLSKAKHRKRRGHHKQNNLQNKKFDAENKDTFKVTDVNTVCVLNEDDNPNISISLKENLDLMTYPLSITDMCMRTAKLCKNGTPIADQCQNERGNTLDVYNDQQNKSKKFSDAEPTRKREKGHSKQNSQAKPFMIPENIKTKDQIVSPMVLNGCDTQVIIKETENLMKSIDEINKDKSNTLELDMLTGDKMSFNSDLECCESNKQCDIKSTECVEEILIKSKSFIDNSCSNIKQKRKVGRTKKRGFQKKSVRKLGLDYFATTENSSNKNESLPDNKTDEFVLSNKGEIDIVDPEIPEDMIDETLQPSENVANCKKGRGRPRKFKATEKPMRTFTHENANTCDDTTAAIEFNEGENCNTDGSVVDDMDLIKDTPKGAESLNTDDGNDDGDIDCEKGLKRLHSLGDDNLVTEFKSSEALSQCLSDKTKESEKLEESFEQRDNTLKCLKTKTKSKRGRPKQVKLIETSLQQLINEVDSLNKEAGKSDIGICPFIKEGSNEQVEVENADNPGNFGAQTITVSTDLTSPESVKESYMAKPFENKLNNIQAVEDSKLVECSNLDSLYPDNLEVESQTSDLKDIGHGRKRNSSDEETSLENVPVTKTIESLDSIVHDIPVKKKKRGRPKCAHTNLIDSELFNLPVKKKGRPKSIKSQEHSTPAVSFKEACKLDMYADIINKSRYLKVVIEPLSQSEIAKYSSVQANSNINRNMCALPEVTITDSVNVEKDSYSDKCLIKETTNSKNVVQERLSKPDDEHTNRCLEISIDTSSHDLLEEHKSAQDYCVNFTECVIHQETSNTDLNQKTNTQSGFPSIESLETPDFKDSEKTFSFEKSTDKDENTGLNLDEDLAAYCEEREESVERNIVLSEDNIDSEQSQTGGVTGNMVNETLDTENELNPQSVNSFSREGFSKEGSVEHSCPDVSQICSNVNNIRYRLQQVRGRLTNDIVDGFDVKCLVNDRRVGGESNETTDIQNAGYSE